MLDCLIERREEREERKIKEEEIMSSATGDDASSSEKMSKVARIIGRTTDVISTIGQGVETAFASARPYFHYAYVPLIIYLGMRTEPKPSIFQIISPL